MSDQLDTKRKKIKKIILNFYLFLILSFLKTILIFISV